MKRRPKIFSLLALFFCTIPLITVLVTALHQELPLESAIQLFKISFNKPYLYTFWAIPIISGLSLLTMRLPSYFIFLSCQITLALGPLIWPSFIPDLIKDEAMATIYLGQIVSFITFIYFIVARDKKFFFDPALRWWERSERYHLPIPMSLKNDHFPNIIDTTILNISQTGIFFINTRKDTHEFKIGERFMANISFQEIELSLPIKIVRKGSFDGISGHGAVFVMAGLWSRIYIKRLINEIKEFRKEHTDYIENKKAS